MLDSWYCLRCSAVEVVLLSDKRMNKEKNQTIVPLEIEIFTLSMKAGGLNHKPGQTVFSSDTQRRCVQHE